MINNFNGFSPILFWFSVNGIYKKKNAESDTKYFFKYVHTNTIYKHTTIQASFSLPLSSLFHSRNAIQLTLREINSWRENSFSCCKIIPSVFE